MERRHVKLEGLEMRRSYIIDSIKPIFHAPLTSNGDDVIGGLTPSADSSAVTYSINGVRITASPRVNFQYNIPNSIALAAKSVYFEYLNDGDSGQYMYGIHLGYANTGSSYNGGYRMMYAFKYNANGLINYSRSSNRYDDGDISVPFTNAPNVWHKAIMQVSPTSLKMCIDGVIYVSRSIVDGWNNWNNSYQSLLAIGSRAYNPNYPNLTRSLVGYVKEVKMYDVVFSDDELTDMTL